MPAGRVILSRYPEESIVLIDAQGRQVARVSVGKVRGSRVALLVESPPEISVARGEVAAGWKPRPQAEVLR